MKKLPLFVSRRLSPLLLFVALASVAGAQTTQYTQFFTNTNAATGNKRANSVGWNFYVGAGATDMSNTDPTTSNVDTGGISLGASNPSSDPAGVLFASPAATANQIFAATTTFTTAFNADTFTWRQGNGSTTASVYLMIQQGGNWYASTTAFQNTSAYTGSSFSSAGLTADTGKSLTFTTSAANWHLVTLNPNATLSYSLTALPQDLASSTITGVGFYIQSTTFNQNIRIDTLNITGTAVAIPEPSAYAMVAGLSVLGLVAGRRRLSRRDQDATC